MGLALTLGARHVGAGGRNSKRCAMGVLGAGARAVDRYSPRLYLQGANILLQLFVDLDWSHKGNVVEDIWTHSNSMIEHAPTRTLQHGR